MKQVLLFPDLQLGETSLGPKSNYTDYNAYINSQEWKTKRKKAFQILGKKCSRCGSTELLEVHHVNYENLFNESASDVAIVCKRCHPVADDQRATEKGFDTWVRKRHGDCLGAYHDDPIEYEKFQNWKYKNSY